MKPWITSLKFNLALCTEILVIFYQNFMSNVLFNFIGSSVVFFEFYNKSNYLSIWYISFLIILLIRYALFYWYRSSPINSDFLKVHYYFYLIGLALTALFWGLAGSAFMPETLSDQALMTMVILLVVGVSTRRIYANNVGAISYLLLVLLPTLIWYLLKTLESIGHDFYFSGFIFIAIYFILLLITTLQKDSLLANNLNFHFERSALFEEYVEGEQRFRDLAEFAPYGILIFTDEIIEYANQSMLDILHAKNRAQIVGKNIYDIVPLSHHSVIKQRILNLENNKRNGVIENKIIALDGVVVDVETKSSLLSSQNGLTVQVFVQDISLRVKAQKKLVYLSTHDPLTGLPNRFQLEEDINNSIKFAKQNQELLAIVFINIDKFKNVNNNFGFNSGDRVLNLIAHRLRNYVREIDTLARIEGDEFGILINQVKSNDAIAKFADTIALKLQEPIQLEQNTIYLTCSIGISVFSRDGTNADELLQNARMAMNEIKSKGGKSIQFCSPELKHAGQYRSTLEIQLHDAIKKDEFFLVYQPKVCLNTNTITGLEALVRWNRDGTLILPDKFIPVAEDTGLINVLTEQILDKILFQIQSWQRMNVPLYKISINLSACSFQHDDNIVNLFKNKLKKFRLNPELLAVEITETVLLQNFELSLSVLSQLKKIGIQSSIDDFGTGYSSLAYLKYLQMDYLKIDKSFISSHRIINASDAVIVKTIIDMAHNLNMKVVAEGVETQEQLHFLKENGCDEVQGYLIAKPLNEKNLVQFLTHFKDKTV